MNAEDEIENLLRPRLRPWRWRRVRNEEELVNQTIAASRARFPSPAKISRSRRRSLRRFHRNLARAYGRALRYSEAAVQACTESVLEVTPVLAFYEVEIKEAGAAFQLQHAQAVRATWECIELLRLGYGQGALAHARTVLELSVAVQALATRLETNPSSSVARKFFDHEELTRARQAIEHDKLSQMLNHAPDDAENQIAAQEVIDGYKARLGVDGVRQFQKDWGWLGNEFGVASPGFREVSRFVGMEGWYDYYRLASNVTHGGTRGPVLNRIEFRGSQVPSYGPTNLFLVDPAQVSLMRLGSLAATIVAFAVRTASNTNLADDEEMLVDRRLRQMRALAMVEYAEKTTRLAVDEFFFVDAHIDHMEDLIAASAFRRSAARAHYRARRFVRTFYTSSSRP